MEFKKLKFKINKTQIEIGKKMIWLKKQRIFYGITFDSFLFSGNNQSDTN